MTITDSKLCDMVTKFINQDIDNLIAFGGYDVYSSDISYNRDVILNRTNKGLFITNSNINALTLINSIEGINVIQHNNKVTVNGLEWDGSKTNINLFL